MVTRSRFCRAVSRQGVWSWQKFVSSRWWYAAVLLLSMALLQRTVTWSTASLLGSSPDSNFSCANFSDPVTRDRAALATLPEDERYMWYAPHDGFDEQVVQLATALKVAMLLNRTLVVPPIFDEGEVAMGHCLDSHLTPQELRHLAWSAVAERIADSRYAYVSAADVIDLRSVSPSKVRTIDMRVFLALWCGIDVSAACGAEAPACSNFTEAIRPWQSLRSCMDRFVPRGRSCLVYQVDVSCKSTIWTNSETASSRDFRNQMLDNQILPDSGTAAERDESRSVVQSLGPGEYSLLTFGSLVADIRPARGDEVMEQAFAAVDALPYAEEIMRGTRAILELLQLTSRPFVCAHLALGDVRHAEALRSRLETLVRDGHRSRSRGKVNLFPRWLPRLLAGHCLQDDGARVRPPVRVRSTSSSCCDLCVCVCVCGRCSLHLRFEESGASARHPSLR